MELWVTVYEAKGSHRELAIEADPSCQAAQLAIAIARHTGIGDSSERAPRLFCLRTDEWLAEEAPLSALDLRMGDSLMLGSERDTPTPRPGRGELVLVSGPLQGTRIALRPGRHLVGRGEGADIRLDDPFMSRSHYWIDVSASSIAISDVDSSNGTWLNDTKLTGDGSHPAEAEDEVYSGRTRAVLRTSVLPRSPLPTSPTGDVPFNREPRAYRAPKWPSFTLPPPPRDPQKPRVPLVASVAPLLMGGALYLITDAVATLAFVALSPVMAIGSFLENLRSGRLRFKKGKLEFFDNLQSLVADLERAVEEEGKLRREARPDAFELWSRARGHARNLWERRPEDDDFLEVRVGMGDLPSETVVDLPEGGNEALRQDAKSRMSRFQMIDDVPATVDLRDAGMVGLAGPADRVASLARWIVCQVGTLHSPRFVSIAAALPPEYQSEWAWLKWFPHVRNEGSRREAARIASDSVQTRKLLEEITQLIQSRRENAGARFKRAQQDSMILLVLHPDLAERSLVEDILEEGPAFGVLVLWLGDDVRYLPPDCHTTVELADDATLTVSDLKTGETTSDVFADGMTPEVAREIAVGISPLHDISAGGRATRLPTRVSLLELLGFDSDPSPEVVVARWESNSAHRGASIGLAASGPLTVDLRLDGPHALLGGITGSGKSELLQSVIAGFALTHPPSRITFLLIDYKGAAAFKDCEHFPHTVGLVTDLDGRLVHRVLISLRAELRRRERVLQTEGAKDLATMERKNPRNAPPSLVLIVDEFAALKQELPAFVDGVIDIAQRGRSLGIHLILATQKPAGVISDRIRANTDLKIALRVGDEQDSLDVIGVNDAAHIPKDLPGRGYARRGQTGVVEFQSAYVGDDPERWRNASAEVAVRSLGFSGLLEERRTPSEVPSLGHHFDTELSRIGRSLAKAAVLRGEPAPQRPWLAPLPPLIPLTSLTDAVTIPDGVLSAVVGLVDLPDDQSQEPHVIDFSRDGSLLVFGASGAGKTTTLRTLAASCAMRMSPRDLRIYGLDFSGRGLNAIEVLPQVGSVIPGEDDERVTRLFRMLASTLEERRELFNRAGVGSLEAYRNTEDQPVNLPRILVLLNGYGGFTSAYERVNLGRLVDTLQQLVSEGRSFGVHFAISADRRAAVPPAIHGSALSTIVLALASEDEYGMFGIRPASIRGAVLPPGRGFVGADREFQCAVVGEEPNELAQRAALASLAATLEMRSPGVSVPKIDVLPAHVRRSALPGPRGVLSASLGVSDLDLRPLDIDLSDSNFLISGHYGDGRSTTLGTIAQALRKSDASLDLRLLAPRVRSPLLSSSLWSSVARGPDECAAAIADIAEIARRRDPTAVHDPIVVIVDDGEELLEGNPGQLLETALKRGRDVNLRFVIAVETAAAMQRGFTGWMREIKKERHGVLLSPRSDLEERVFDTSFPRAGKRASSRGRGFLMKDGQALLIQVAAD